jgi:phage recombination protein Bet
VIEAIAVRLVDSMPVDSTPEEWAELLILICGGDRAAARDLLKWSVALSKQPKGERMETKEAEKQATPEMQPHRSPLAKVVPIEDGRIDLFNPQKWTKEDLDVIKKSVCPAGIPDADFKLFVLKCQASGMNPLLGEAFCVKRNQNIGTKDSPKWIEVFQFTPGEQGMEGRADDFADFRGLRAAAYYEKDKIVIDASAGEVSHQYDPAHDRGRLLGAWAIAFREGRKTPVEDLKLGEYVDARNPKWNGSPHTMIVKCARAAALRRAYPNKFDGIFVREELRDEDSAPTGALSELANRDTTDKLAEKMKATAQAQAEISTPPKKASEATVDVAPSKPALEVVKPQAEEKKPEPLPSQVADAKKAEAAAQGPLMVFGDHKGKPISTLSGPELLENVGLGERKIPSLDTQAKKDKVRACIDAIKAEMAKREAALLNEKPPREPGSDDDID